MIVELEIISGNADLLINNEDNKLIVIKNISES